MRYGVIADIHGNLPALKAVLDDIAAQKCTHVACLGDLVGYGANPKECLKIVRGMNIPVVKGNHDEMCSVEENMGNFNPHAAEAVRWARQQLDDDDKKWLRGLKHVRLVAGFSIVHATLDQPERWQYVFDKLAAATSFVHQTTPICFFGHTHVPVAFILDSVVHGGMFSKFKIESNKKYFINVGSVGQPRDNDPRAAYVIYDLDDQTVELRRIKFNQDEDEGGPGKLVPVKTPPKGGPPHLSAAEKLPTGDDEYFRKM